MNKLDVNTVTIKHCCCHIQSKERDSFTAQEPSAMRSPVAVAAYRQRQTLGRQPAVEEGSHPQSDVLDASRLHDHKNGALKTGDVLQRPRSPRRTPIAAPSGK